MNERDLLDPLIADILTHLKSNSNQRYQDLKEHVNISDATLSKKINLLKSYEIIEPHSTKNKVGRNYIVYSLTPIGVKMEKAISEYLEHIDTEVEV